MKRVRLSHAVVLAGLLSACSGAQTASISVPDSNEVLFFVIYDEGERRFIRYEGEETPIRVSSSQARVFALSFDPEVLLERDPLFDSTRLDSIRLAAPEESCLMARSFHETRSARARFWGARVLELSRNEGGLEPAIDPPEALLEFILTVPRRPDCGLGGGALEPIELSPEPEDRRFDEIAWFEDNKVLVQTDRRLYLYEIDGNVAHERDRAAAPRFENTESIRGLAVLHDEELGDPVAFAGTNNGLARFRIAGWTLEALDVSGGEQEVRDVAGDDGLIVAVGDDGLVLTATSGLGRIRERTVATYNLQRISMTRHVTTPHMIAGEGGPVIFGHVADPRPLREAPGSPSAFSPKATAIFVRDDRAELWWAGSRPGLFRFRDVETEWTELDIFVPPGLGACAESEAMCGQEIYTSGIRKFVVLDGATPKPTTLLFFGETGCDDIVAYRPELDCAVRWMRPDLDRPPTLSHAARRGNRILFASGEGTRNGLPRLFLKQL